MSSLPPPPNLTLVVGATGALGRQVVDALIERGKPVRALVRPASDATALEQRGVRLVRGDMLDPASLQSAFAGVDAVITSAVGYTRRRKSDTGATDVQGNRNLALAAREAGVRRLVFGGILASDQTPQIPHFWNKTLSERAFAEAGVPWVSLRPGAFLDQIIELQPGGGLDKGRLLNLGSARVPMTFVISRDVAEALADLVDTPGAEGHLDLGWTAPVSMQRIAELCSAKLGRRVRVRSLPWAIAGPLLWLVGRVSEQAADLRAMLAFFQTGRSVADTTAQRDLLGNVPTPEAAIAAWLDRRASRT